MGFNFKKGVEEVEEALKSSGSSFRRTHYLDLKAGEKVVLRFLTEGDEWIKVNQHGFVPTRTAAPGYTGEKWPTSMTGVCRRDVAFNGAFPDCFVCDHVLDKGKPHQAKPRFWALACLREEVLEGGRVVGYKDATRVVSEMRDGQKVEIEEKAVIIINQAAKTFFGTLGGFYSQYGTVLDRDYMVKRTAEGKDTDYNIIPLDPVPGTLPSGEQVPRFDLRIPEFMERYTASMPNLGDVVADKASDEYFAMWFDTRVPQPKWGSKSDDSTPDTDAGSTQNDVDHDAVAEFAGRAMGYGSSAEAPAAATPAPAAASTGMRDFG